MLVGAQLRGGGDDCPHEQVLEVGGPLDPIQQQGEEPLQLAHPEGLEEHVLAAREHPVDRRPGHVGRGGDVVDGDLLEAPPLAAGLGGVEHPHLHLGRS